MRNSKIFGLILGIGIMITGCTDKPKTKTETPQFKEAESKPEKAPEEKPVLKKVVVSKPVTITKLNGLPAVISGCSCYFSESDTDFKNEKFLFAHNYEGLGLISLDNKIVTLKLVKSTRDSTAMVNQNYQETYANELYTATINVSYQKKAGDETWWNEGVLTLTGKGRPAIKKQLVGECGC